MFTDHGGFDLLTEASGSLLRDVLVDVAPLSPVPAAPISTPDLTGIVDFDVTVTGAVLDSMTPRAFISVTSLMALRDTGLPPIEGIRDTFNVEVNLHVEGLEVVATSDLSPIRFFDRGVKVDNPQLELLVAEIEMTSGSEAAAEACARIAADLNGLRNQAASALAPFDGARVLRFPDQISPDSPATSSMVLDTRNLSLRLGVRLDDPDGDPSAIRTDNLGDDALLALIPNDTLLGDLLRPLVDRLMRLTESGAGSFLGDHPLYWNGSAPFIELDGVALELTQVSAATAAPDQIRLSLRSRAVVGGGAAFVHANADVIAALEVQRVGNQLVVNPRIIEVDTLDSRVDVEWWVYLVAVLAPSVAAAIAVADEILDGEVDGRIAAEVERRMLGTIQVALPAGLPADLRVRRVEMIPSEPRLIGPASGRGLEAPHELLIGLG